MSCRTQLVSQACDVQSSMSSDCDPMVSFSSSGRIQTTSYVWYMILILFFACLLGVLAVTIPVETIMLLNKLPKDIDVVLVDRPGALSKGVIAEQVALVDRNMKFRRNIYILSSSPTGPATTFDAKNVFFSNFTPTSTDPAVSLRECYLAMGGIVGIAERAIFLGDATFPYRRMDKTLLFDGERPKMFNFFKPVDYTSFYAPFLNETLPCFAQDTLLFARLQSTTLDDQLRELLMLERTEHGYSVHHGFNRDVLLNGDASFASNRAIQLEELAADKPIFATFHVSGDAPTVLTELAAHLLEFTQ